MFEANARAAAQSELLPEGPSVSAVTTAEALYLEHRPLLTYLGTFRFGIPPSETEALIQEVFVSYLQNASRIENVRAWLVAAMSNASRYYHRVRKRTETRDGDALSAEIDRRGFAPPTADRLATEMAVGKMLRYLQPRCRETLRLHYFEEKTAADIAVEFDTTRRYAEKLIHNCLRRARQIYETIVAVQR